MDRLMILSKLHNPENGVKWKLTEEGIWVDQTGIERTEGEPTTVKSVWDQYHLEINQSASNFKVCCELIIATICTESGGHADARRNEPGFLSDEETPDRASIGLMQTLIATARTALGNPEIEGKWLLTPGNSISAGTAYITKQKVQTSLDPPRVACAYNAGGVYSNDGETNRWKMKQYPIGTGQHCDRFVKWFNDAVAMLKEHPVKPSLSWSDFLSSLN